MAASAPSHPELLFICGPVGCGNTFLFRSLLQDPRTYGVNEGNLALALANIHNSRETGFSCPHADESFASFLHALAGDRPRFIEKTPASIRYQDMLRAALPHCRFLFTVREPHAALVSALDGRSVVNDIEHVARLWLSDTSRIEDSTDRDLTILYEDFVAAPRPTLERVSERIFPLSDEVFRFAERMARPDRADGERWRGKVDAPTAEAIEHSVQELGLDKRFAWFRERYSHLAEADAHASAPTAARRGLWKRTQTELFAARDKLQRRSRAWRSGAKKARTPPGAPR